MANYSTLLKTWGDTGSEYPDGYSYLEGEQPVDAWDNYLIYNVVEDLQGLIDTTNNRVESEKGAAGGEPASPEDSHLYYDEDNERLEHYDAAASAWHGVMKVDGDTMQGALDMGGYGISNTGAIELGGTLKASGNGVTGVSSIAKPDTDNYLDFTDPTTGKLLRLGDNGDITVPNGSLIMDGESTGDGDIRGVESIYADGMAIASLRTNGGPWRVFDSTNGQVISIFREGGNVEIPNGDLDFSDSGSIKNISNIQAYSASNLTIRTGGNGTRNIQLYDSANGSTLLQANEGGSVEIFGNLYVKNGSIMEGGDNVVSSSSGDYDIQKNGTDGSGHINFKT